MLLSLYGGCGSGGGDNLGCVLNDRIMFSDCLAEDILDVCEQFFCGGTFPPVGDNPPISTDFFFPPRPFEEGMNIECVALDCNTLDCGTAGFFSDLDIWTNGMPTGLISLDPEVQFVCF